MNRKIVVLDGYTLNPGDLSWDALIDLGDVEIYDRTPNELIYERSKEAQLLLTNKTPLDANMLAKLPKLKYVGVLATGMNVIDLNAASKLGITVTNIPAYSTASVAQFTFALLLEHCHQVSMHNSSVHAGQWCQSIDFSYQLSPLLELSGKTFGIFGFGHIGQACAKIAEAFGMKVIFYTRSTKNPSDFPNYEQVSQQQLFKRSDVLSLNCPLTPDTQEIVNEETLALMKRSAILINTGRGPLVNEAHLAKALDDQIIAGYATDVLSTEPPQADNPLLGAPNCTITPHIAWKTKEARTRLLKIAISNVTHYLVNIK